MTLDCGILGLPNVGKSSLFNALTSAAAAAENFPFCTIEPNVGVVPIDDQRLVNLAEIAKSAKLVPTAVRLVDIAGLVRGAAAGEGLGNKFLSHVREVDGLVHVLRCFDDPDVIHVSGKIDPVEDAAIVNLELTLADLAVMHKVAEKAAKLARSGDAEVKTLLGLAKSTVEWLNTGKPISQLALSEDDRQLLSQYHLLTAKPMLYCANVDEHDPTTNTGYLAVCEMAKEQNAGVVAVSAKFEAELASLTNEEQQEMLAELGLAQAGLTRLATAAYQLLGLHTFFTVGPSEARAWTIEIGCSAQEAAGKIHTDMQRGFIKAEVISCKDYLAQRGEAGCRNAGLLRSEGRDYLVADGDVIHFRFNV